MVAATEKLVQSLDLLKILRNKNGLAIIKSSILSRTHLSRLVNNGFRQEVIKKRSISSRPGSLLGDTTAWYTSFWNFVVTYATEKVQRSVESQSKLDAYHYFPLKAIVSPRNLLKKFVAKIGNLILMNRIRIKKKALAARGYWQAFQEMKKSVKKVLEGDNPRKVAESDHRKWYQELFQPCVSAGIVKPTDLPRYCSLQVYIRDSLHAPLNPEAVRDAMPKLLELLTKETNVRVRTVLGHFLFTYIPPYMDGNGCIGRFMLNVMLTSGSYNWIIILVERRQEYMAALEKVSVQGNITDFTQFIVPLLYSARSKIAQCGTSHSPPSASTNR